jgi:putative endonuclease
MGARSYYVYILASRLKKWTRAWKISQIEKDNPNWIDLFPEIAGGGG